MDITRETCPKIGQAQADGTLPSPSQSLAALAALKGRLGGQAQTIFDALESSLAAMTGNALKPIRRVGAQLVFKFGASLYLAYSALECDKTSDEALDYYWGALYLCKNGDTLIGPAEAVGAPVCDWDLKATLGFFDGQGHFECEDAGDNSNLAKEAVESLIRAVYNVEVEENDDDDEDEAEEDSELGI